MLEEKWRQAYQSAFRFGPPQPSMVYRYLRMLEGVSPPLALTHLSCQTSAKAFVATREYALLLLGGVLMQRSVRQNVFLRLARERCGCGAACARRSSGRWYSDGWSPTTLLVLHA